MKLALVIYGDFSKFGDPYSLSAALIADLKSCSGGIAEYEIVVQLLHPEDTPLVTPTGVGNADYAKIIADNDLDGRVARHEIDEVWLWGNGHAGLLESTMIGQEAFFINGGPTGTYSCPPLIIMGFNYECTEPYALHSFGHRSEWCIGHLYGDTPDYVIPAKTSIPANDFQRFTSFEAQRPGYCGMGNVHFPPLGGNYPEGYDYACKGSEVWAAQEGTGDPQHDFLRWWFRAMPADWWRSILLPLARWRVPMPQPVDLLRLNHNGAYLNTTSADEAKEAVAHYDFTLEGVVGRVLPPL